MAGEAIIRIQVQNLQGIQNFDRSTQRVDRNVQNIQRQLGQFRNIVNSAFAATAVIGFARSLTNILDTATLVENRLGLAVGRGVQLGETFETVAMLAQSTRNPLEGTARLFERIARGGRDAGVSVGEALELTETFNQGLIVSGATVQEQFSAILQFSQAFASGVLQGEELRSLRESFPALARQIAVSLGGSLEDLKEFAREGLITRDVMIQALRDMADTTQAQFDMMEISVGQAAVVLQTDVISAARTFDDWTGSTNLLADAMVALGDNLPEVAAGFATIATALGGGGLFAFVRFLAANPAVLAALTATTGATVATGVLTRAQEGQAIVEDLDADRRAVARAVESGNPSLIATSTQSLRENIRRGRDLGLHGAFSNEERRAIVLAERMLEVATGVTAEQAQNLEGILRNLGQATDPSPSATARSNQLQDQRRIVSFDEFGNPIRAGDEGGGVRAGLAAGTLTEVVGPEVDERREREREREEREAERARRAEEFAQRRIDFINESIGLSEREVEVLRFRNTLELQGVANVEQLVMQYEMALERSERFNDQLELQTEYVDGFTNTLESGLVQAFETGEISLRSFGRQLLNVFARSTITNFISNPLNTFLGGSIGAGVAHDGGIIGVDSFPVRQVDPRLFLSAKRYHQGLRANEFPAILERGEEVIPRSEVSSARGNTQIINVTLPESIRNMDDLDEAGRELGRTVNNITGRGRR